MSNYIEGVVITPLRQVKTDKGDIYHGLKASDSTFKAFGEAYFSNIFPRAIKGWKRHHKATLNIVVPVGAIEFVIYDDRENSGTNGKFRSVILSADESDKYCRLTVAPGLWLAFRGLANITSLLLDIIDIEHIDSESDRKQLDTISYPW